MSLLHPARLLALIGLFITMSVADVGSAATARADGEQPVIEHVEIGSCSDFPPPCVDSVLRNGVPIDGYWGFQAQETLFHYEGRTMKTVRFGALGEFGTDMGFESLTDTWQVTLELGDLVPRGAAGYAQGVTVERTARESGTYAVQITAHPVTLSGQCQQSPICPEWADYPDADLNPQWDGMLDLSVTDFGTWSDPDLLDSVYGVDVFTNAAVSSIPPSIRHDDATGTDYLWIEMANRHYYEDGTTVVQGSEEVRIPNEFLRKMYGIPNPELMTSESLDPTVTGPTAGNGQVEVTQEPGGDAMLVRITGVTFSHRVVKILRGVVVPTRPGALHAERLSSSRAQVEFTRSQVRGAKVTGYQVRCAPTSGNRPVVTAHGRSPVTVTGLASGTAYTCSVRARSKAGPGAWSKGVAVPR